MSQRLLGSTALSSSAVQEFGGAYQQPPLAAAAVAALSAVGGALAGGSTLAGAIAVLGTKAVLVKIAVAALLAGAQMLLTPKPKGPTPKEISRMVRQPISPRQLVYGRCRPDTVVLYVDVTNDKKYLHLVLAVAGHEIDAFESVQFNDQVVWQNGGYTSVRDSERTVYTHTSTGGGEDRVTTTTSEQVTDPWSDYARINFHHGGANQAADADLVSESENWTNAHRLRGIAYMYVRLRFKQKVYPAGIPNITATVRGKKILDTRTNVTAWSQNAAMIQRDYLLDQTLGVRALPSEIDEASFIAGANLADEPVAITGGGTEPRYQLNGWSNTDAPPRDLVEGKLTANASYISYASGVFRLTGGAYRPVTAYFDHSNLRGGIHVQTRQSIRDTYNGVRGTFRPETDNFIPNDYPSVISSTYSTQDGEPRFRDYPLNYTSSPSAAQRIAHLALLQSRQMMTVALPMTLDAMDVVVGDTIAFSHEKYGWTNKQFEVVSWNFSIADNGEIGINIVGKETGPAIWDWTTSLENPYVTGPPSWLPSPFNIAPPTAVSANYAHVLQKDRTSLSIIAVNWTASPETDNTEIQWSKDAFVTTQNAFSSTGFYEISPVGEGEAYFVRVRAVTVNGKDSPWVLASDVVASGDGTIPDPPTALTVTPGYRQNTLTWTNPNNEDFDRVAIYRGPSGNFSNATEILQVRGEPGKNSSYVDSALGFNSTYHYWLRALDDSGNESARTDPSVSGTTTPVSAPEISGVLDNAEVSANSIQASHLANGAVSPASLSTEVAGSITDAAQSALADKNAAEAAATAAATAQANSETAQGLSEQAQTAAESASNQASAAQTAAETAEASADALSVAAAASATAAASSEAVAASSAEASEARAAGNLITNWNFSDGTSGWTAAGGDSVEQITGISSARSAEAIRLTDNDTDGNASALEANSYAYHLAGQTIRISGDYRTDATNAAVQGQIGFNYERQDGTFGNAWQVLPSAQSWTPFSFEVTIPANAVAARPRIRALNTNAGEWVDYTHLRMSEVTSEIAAQNHAVASASSAALALTSETEAETAASSATSAQVQAEAARDASEGFSTASQTSATNAGASATDASNSASVADTHRIDAEASRDQADTSALSAAASATSASGFADDSSASATASENSRIAAEAAETASGASATAAASSQTSAAASATSATQSASTATSEAASAATAASNAESYRDTALTARDDAEGHSADASVQANIAVSAASQNIVRKGTFNDGDITPWPATAAVVADTGAPGQTQVLQVTGVLNEGTFIPGPWAGRRIRLRGWAWCNGVDTARFGLNVERSGTGNTTDMSYTLAAANTWTEFDIEDTVRSDAEGIRARVDLGGSGSGTEARFALLRIEDIDQSYQSGLSASAAQADATIASSEASASAASATLSQTHANAAATEASNALTYRNEAVTARDDAQSNPALQFPAQKTRKQQPWQQGRLLVAT